ncbi:metal ABC transporter substrate-binding protein [Anoxybacteroides tepidamans]|uniref:metal ABC transporter substrate-binding protein n=1 Tax=Anoxybacteroides tepidamans TaxID=265948 RepID=UPI000488D30E|nr:metal ABC transporter substrate-binding protein [Anoxybacillus tepidamans]
MKKLIIPLIIFLMLVSGCSHATEIEGKKDARGTKKLHIVTTFYPMYYFAKKVAGNLADVDLLIPNGVEPHDWEPTAKDMAIIQDSDVFIYNSRYFETWTEKVLNSIDRSNLKIVEASKGIELIDGISEEGENHKENTASKDPHVWLSPVLASQEVDNITKALEQKDPKNKEQYEKNAAVFKSQLADLDRLYKKTINEAKKKEFVTQHAAFGYLAKQYGITQIPIAGLSPDVEPSLSKLTELTELMKKKNIKVIYFEGLVSSKVAQTLANEIGAKTEVLNPLEGLTKEDQKKGLDYIGVMKKNLDALKLSLY